MNGTLPSLAEDVIDSVIQSVSEDIEWLLDQFMPDGRPFGREVRSEKEQLAAYVQSGLRDDPEVAKNWIREKASELTQFMQQFNIPPDLMASVHPYDVAIQSLIVFSAKMETLLAEHASTLLDRVAPAETPLPPPTAPQPEPVGGTMNVGSVP